MITYLSSVEANKEKMMELTDSLRVLYVDATYESGREVSNILKDLRKVQGTREKTSYTEYKPLITTCSTALRDIFCP